jgi:hypothetical protein
MEMDRNGKTERRSRRQKRQSLRHPDLSPLMQAVLLSAVTTLTAMMLFRVVVFFRNQYAGVSYCYPTNWTNEQIKMFGLLRLSIGGCLGITWLTLLMAAPQLPVSWPFGFEQALLTTGLLLLTNDWLLLLVRSNWENSLLSKCRFQIGFAIVVLWWIAVLSGVLATISWVMTRHIHLVFPHGTIA